MQADNLGAVEPGSACAIREHGLAAIEGGVGILGIERECDGQRSSLKIGARNEPGLWMHLEKRVRKNLRVRDNRAPIAHIHRDPVLLHQRPFHLKP